MRAEIAQTTIARLDRHILPLFFAAYFVNFLDRTNIGFAALRMNDALGFGPAVYGLGAGIFFIGYFLFEVPSNMALARVGARLWIARIMVTWGLVSAATAFVRTPEQFYAARFLLGVAEAGFVPAMLVHLGRWYPAEHRTGAVAKVWTATAAAIVLGGPISAALLALDGRLGLAGWQWIFLLEGLPAVLLGAVVLRLVDERPADARWLTKDQRAWLEGRLAAEMPVDAASAPLGRVLRRAALWRLGLLYACLGIGFFGITFWLPQAIGQAGGLTTRAASLAAAIPFALAAVAMVLVARLADRRGEAARLATFGCVVAAIGFVGSGLAASPTVAIVSGTVGAMALWSVVALFWQLPPVHLGRGETVLGVAAINALGSLGGFVGPYAVGLMRARGLAFDDILLVLAAIMVAAAMLANSLRPAR